MKWLKKAGYVLCLLVFLLLTLGPFVWAFILSITPEHAMLAKSAALLPEVVTWKNYLELFGGSRKGQLLFAGIANSLKAVGMTLLVGIPICLMSAYTCLLYTSVFPIRKSGSQMKSLRKRREGYGRKKKSYCNYCDKIWGN